MSSQLTPHMTGPAAPVRSTVDDLPAVAAAPRARRGAAGRDPPAGGARHARHDPRAGRGPADRGSAHAAVRAPRRAAGALRTARRRPRRPRALTPRAFLLPTPQPIRQERAMFTFDAIRARMPAGTAEHGAQPRDGRLGAPGLHRRDAEPRSRRRRLPPRRVRAARDRRAPRAPRTPPRGRRRLLCPAMTDASGRRLRARAAPLAGRARSRARAQELLGADHPARPSRAARALAGAASGGACRAHAARRCRAARRRARPVARPARRRARRGRPARRLSAAAGARREHTLDLIAEGRGSLPSTPCGAGAHGCCARTSVVLPGRSTRFAARPAAPTARQPEAPPALRARRHPRGGRRARRHRPRPVRSTARRHAPSVASSGCSVAASSPLYGDDPGACGRSSRAFTSAPPPRTIARARCASARRACGRRREVRLDGADADEQRGGDLLVVAAFRRQHGHAPLRLGQLSRRRAGAR